MQMERQLLLLELRCGDREHGANSIALPACWPLLLLPRGPLGSVPAVHATRSSTRTATASGQRVLFWLGLPTGSYYGP
jgi:hypothetical protein